MSNTEQKAGFWMLMDARDLEGDAGMTLHYSPLRDVFRVAVHVENEMAELEFDPAQNPVLDGLSDMDAATANSIATQLVEKLELGMD